MATYLTGRTRTLTFSGAIGGTLHIQAFGPEPPYPVWEDGTGILSLPYYAGGCIFGGFEVIIPNESGFIFPSPVLVNLTLGMPGNVSNVTANHGYVLGGVMFNLLVDCTGTWSISAPVEEVIEFDGVAYPPGNIGTQLIDPPQPTNIRIYEQTVIGGTIEYAVYAGDLISGTHSIPITSDNQMPIISSGSVYDGYQVNATVVATSHGGDTAAASLTTEVNGVPVGAPGSSGSSSGTDSSQTWDCTLGAAATSTAITTGFAFGPTAKETAILIACPPRPFTQAGRISALNSNYPADIKVVLNQYAGSPGLVVDVPSGSFSTAYTQQSYTAENTAGVIVSYSDNSGVSGTIQAASLTTNGEDTTLTRIMGRGFLWNAMTMTQAESMNVDNAPQIANWTAGTNTTLANSGSDELTAAVSGGLGSLSSTLPIADTALKDSQWVGVSFCGYRFLRMMLTGDDDDTKQPASVLIGTKQWDITVGTDGYVDIDLCCPTNRSSSTDTHDTQWEWNGPSPYSVNDTVAWGVSNVSTLTIKNLANGHTYTLSGIHLVRNDHAGMTFLPTYKGWLQAFPSVTIGEVVSTTYYRRARQADTDGRQSREDTDAVWIHTDDGSGTVTDTYSEVAISAVVAALHTGGVPPRDGWDATDLMPNPGTCTGTGSLPLYNCYLNSDRSSCYLFGSGAIYDGKRWTFGFDIGCTSSATIPAQILYDSITDWYPDCGDVWGWQGGGYGALQVQCAAILRGSAYGLVCTPAGQGASDVLVDVKDAATGLIDVGTGYSSWIGEYKTGAPYGSGLVSYKVTAESGSIPYPNLTGTFISRHRSRFCFPGQPVPLCCSIIFCPNDFLFPFIPLAGDHTILPLDDYEGIPDVVDKQQEQEVIA